MPNHQQSMPYGLYPTLDTTQLVEIVGWGDVGQNRWNDSILYMLTHQKSELSLIDKMVGAPVGDVYDISLQAAKILFLDEDAPFREYVCAEHYPGRFGVKQLDEDSTAMIMKAHLIVSVNIHPDLKIKPYDILCTKRDRALLTLADLTDIRRCDRFYISPWNTHYRYRVTINGEEFFTYTLWRALDRLREMGSQLK